MAVTRVITNSDNAANSKRLGKSKPYTPSWIDRLVDWIDQLPGPAWSYYLGFGITLFLLQLIGLWVEEALQNGFRSLIPFYLAGAITLFLLLFHYLEELSGNSLKTLKPALISSEDEYQTLYYQLTTLPASTTILASLIALAFVLVSESILGTFRLAALDPYPISASLLRYIYLASWWIFGAFIYHTIHQLRLVHRIYTRHLRVNLFQMRSLYAFSNYSALTALSLAAIPYGWMGINPGDWISEPVSLFVMLGITALAVTAFAWPQFGIHRLQIAEKDRLLDEANKRLEATIAELHQRVDAGNMEGMFELNSAISSLKDELRILEEIPTWPWRPETVRWLASALLLPLGLWLLQLLLQRILGS